MADPDGTELIPPRTPDDWWAYHDIRRRALFEARGRFGVYDPDHPDEHLARNHPLLLIHENEPVGTVRVDHRDRDQAVIRLVAIRRDRQGHGHGRRLIEEAERFIRSLGCRKALVNAARAAEDFYRRLGYEARDWDVADGQPESIQMVKRLPET